MIQGDFYCKKCYSKLDPTDGFNRCQQCGRAFNPANDISFLRRPFPNKMRIIIQIVYTTLLGVAVAYVVAMFQMVQLSGH
jgi:predicted amidophosphoribosyltransferase